ncbi:MAG: ABC transporter permease [Chloroflexi bacterium]|nr:ABC transporter permease [Chloroflexota bacterium]MCL5110275.1 ABC transporter permease [Chloroflexota bacterium]
MIAQPARGTSLRQSPGLAAAADRARTVFRVTLPFICLLVVWQVGVILSGLPEYFFPSPATVAGSTVLLVERGILPSYIADSMARFALGVFLGVALAVPTGVAMTLSRRLSEALMPIVNFFHSIVEMAWIPLFVLWFGYGFKTILLSITYVVFFPVLYNTLLGVRTIPKATINAVLVLGAKPKDVILEVLLPGALPNIATGVRLGAGYAFRALIAAEMIAAQSGLGFMIFEARQNQLTHRTIVGMIVMGILWLAIERLYLRPLERVTIERWGMLRRAE